MFMYQMSCLLLFIIDLWVGTYLHKDGSVYTESLFLMFTIKLTPYSRLQERLPINKEKPLKSNKLNLNSQDHKKSR